MRKAQAHYVCLLIVEPVCSGRARRSGQALGFGERWLVLSSWWDRLGCTGARLRHEKVVSSGLWVVMSMMMTIMMMMMMMSANGKSRSGRTDVEAQEFICKY